MFRSRRGDLVAEWIIKNFFEKRAHDLDLKYPGSTFTQVLKTHGKDGRYLVLVVDPFANLSDDFMVLCDFLGHARALKAIHSWNISPKHEMGSHNALTMPTHEDRCKRDQGNDRQL